MPQRSSIELEEFDRLYVIPPIDYEEILSSVIRMEEGQPLRVELGSKVGVAWRQVDSNRRILCIHFVGDELAMAAMAPLRMTPIFHRRQKRNS